MFLLKNLSKLFMINSSKLDVRLIENVQVELSLITEEKLDEIEEVLSANSMISIRRVSPEVNLSTMVVHRAMLDILGYK